MKRIIVLSAIIFALTSFTVEANRHRDLVGGYFYTELSPYGSWIEVDYGVVVWRPTIMVATWMPYRTGRWVWTDDGWYWDSYEPFGYITYHYGRWYYDDYYGWLWYPDYEWAPAWVEWRYDDYYIGWAPLHPYATFSISVGIHFSHSYHSPYHHWHFVKYGRFCDPYVYNYYVGPEYRYRIYNKTKYRTNYAYHNGRVQNRGVDVNYVRNRSGRDIQKLDVVRVRDSKQIRKEGYRNSNQLRTLDVKREELVRNDVKNMNIKRENRKTNLDVSKVEIGDRNKNTRTVKKDQNVNKNRNTKEIKKTQKNERVDRQNVDKKQLDSKRKTDVKNERTVKSNRNNETKNRTKEQVKVQTEQKNKIQKEQRTKLPDTKVQNEKRTINKNQVIKNEQIKVKKDTRNQKTEVKQQKNTSREKVNVTRNEQQVKKNTNTGNRNNERKVQTNRTTTKDNKRERSKR